MTVDPTTLSDEELLAAARPEGWQRMTRAIGCPVLLVLSWMAAASANEVVGALWRPLGWLAAVVAFLFAAPVLMGVISAISSRGKTELEEAMRQRLGQGNFGVAMEALEAELAELAPDQRGYVLLVRAARSDRAHSVQVRLDVREDGVGEIQAVRGPSLNLYKRTLDSLDDWERSSAPASGAWLAHLRGLDAATLQTTGRGPYALHGAFVEVGQPPTIHTFKGRLNPSASEAGSCPAWDLAHELLTELGWPDRG